MARAPPRSPVSLRKFDPATGSNMGYDTMLYVDGNITGLSGPGQGSPAINDGTALTITAAKNATLTGDLLYKSPPVTLTANGSTPADSLIARKRPRSGAGNFHVHWRHHPER